MIDSKIEGELNRQINMEIFAALKYLSMSAWFEHRSLGGMAKWMVEQSKEEWAHAMKIFDYVNERGGRVTLTGQEAPPADFDSVSEVFKAGLESERAVSKSIHGILKLAREKEDYATEVLLNWFVEEQVEEEDSFETLIARLDLAGETGAAILMLDNNLGQRSGG